MTGEGDHSGRGTGNTQKRPPPPPKNKSMVFKKVLNALREKEGAERPLSREGGRLVVPSDPEESMRDGRGHRFVMKHSLDELRL